MTFLERESVDANQPLLCNGNQKLPNFVK